MEIASILAQNIIIMFLMLGVGVLCKIKGILDERDARSLSNLMLMVVVPCMIFRSFQTERLDDMLPGFWLFIVLSSLVYLIMIPITAKLFPASESYRGQVVQIAVVMSNGGFMGIPLLQATLGEKSQLYGAAYIAVLNVVSWLWCAPMLSGGEKMSIRQLLKTPVIIAVILGLPAYLLQITVPTQIHTFLTYMSGMNTPMCMLIIGIFLASTNLKQLLGDRSIYLGVFLRNILYPLATLGLLWLMRLPAWLPRGKEVALAFLILSACPAATTAIIMSARYGRDSEYGSRLVTLSTLLSVVTLPLILLLADIIL